MAFTRKIGEEYGGPEWSEQWRLEQLWSKRHGWFWNLAWRKPAFKKDKP